MPPTSRPLLPNDAVSRARALADFARLLRATASVGRDQYRIQNRDIITSGSQRLQLAAKASVSAGSLGDPDSFAALAELTNAFLSSLQGRSAFDTLLGAMRLAPIGRGFAVSSTALIAPEVGEGQGKPIKALVLEPVAPISPKKIAAIVIITRELARLTEAEQLIDVELRNAAVSGTDQVFLPALIAAAGTTLPSTGDAAQDLAALVNAVPLGVGSRPFFVMGPDLARSLAVMRTAAGDRQFPTIGLVGGGQIFGDVPALVSDRMPAGSALYLDASQIAGNAGSIAIDTSTGADVEMTDASGQSSLTPEGSQNLVSLFQQNMLGVKVERTFGFAVLRASGLAVIEGATWGSTT